MVNITRKKSAKELAAAAALAAQQEQHSGADSKEGIRSANRDSTLEGGSGYNKSLPGVSASHSGGTGNTHPSSTNASNDDSQSLNNAMTLMKNTHSSLERELAELKTSNEMLWRQAMLSREEQLKSQKKLDSLVRFLAGHFGSMNLSQSLLEDLDTNAGAEASSSKSHVHRTTSATSAQRPNRLSKGRMISDGRTLTQSQLVSSDEDMDDDDDLWELGDGPGRVEDEGRQFWEVDDNGKMRKVLPRSKEERNASNRPHLSRTSTPIRSSFRLPTSARKSANIIPTVSSPSSTSSPSHRFERLDGSPGAPSTVQDFDAPTPTTISLDSSNQAGGAAAKNKKNASASSLEPTANNAVALHSSTALAHLNNGQYTLDPSILNLPLGTLLSTPAGAQLLASLGQGAAPFIGPQPAVETSATSVGHNTASRFTDAGSLQGSNSAITTTDTPSGTHGTSSPAWMTAASTPTQPYPHDVTDKPPPPLQNAVDFGAQPGAVNVPGGDASIGSILGNTSIDMTDVSGTGANDLNDADFDWTDPTVKALLQAFEDQQNTTDPNQQRTQLSPLPPAHVTTPNMSSIEPIPNMYTNDDQYDDLFNNQPVNSVDFDEMFGGSSAHNAVDGGDPTGSGLPPLEPIPGSGASGLVGTQHDASAASSKPDSIQSGTESVDGQLESTPSAAPENGLFSGPTRKKRKTDQREP